MVNIRRAVGPILIIAVSMGLVVFLVEIGVRLYTRYAIVYDVEMTRYANEIKVESPNPKIGHVHRPESSAFLMGVPVEINRDGFRDRDYPVERTDARRTVILGDSLTFGWGVEREKTFEFLLEEELGRRAPTELINLGTGNYNTEQEVNLFRDKGLKYSPDQVVLFYFINDAEATPVKSDWEFLGRSRAFTFFWSRTKAAISRFSAGSSFGDYYSGLYQDGQPGWEATKSAFLALREMAQEEGFGLDVVLLPELHQPQDYPFTAEHAKVTEFLDRNDISYLDLAPSFQDVVDPYSLWVALDDAHPNELAHRRIAEETLPLLTGESADHLATDPLPGVSATPPETTAER